jgi:hypothetical protein
MKSILLFFTIYIPLITLSQIYNGKEPKKQEIKIEKAASCTPPQTSTYLKQNNVNALIHTAGNLWQVPNQNYSQYEVPKNSGVMALFTAALWLGGTDVNGQLKLAALRYRTIGQDYWTGPLAQNEATTNYDMCYKYDKHFVSTKDVVAEFNAWFETGLEDIKNGTNKQELLFPNYKIPETIKEWPAHGDVSLGQDFYLAPFYDRNDDGIYNWEEGDYPWFDLDNSKDCKNDRRVSLYGDINYWWVMNDKGNIHTESSGEPIGMEIRAQAFSFSSNDEINNMTFYNYELINRGTQTLYNTFFGFFTDGALGNPNDDYVGCDVNRGLAYYYNGANYDGDVSGFKGYGYSPPAVGVDFFEGPYQDNDGIDNAFGIGENEALNGIGYGDGVIDNERFGMRRFLYYSNTTNGANPNQTDPIKATDYYNYLQGKWKDGTPFYYGGSGHISDPDANTSIESDFMFPGDTDPLGWGTGGVPQEPWTEQTAGNVPNDRRFLQSAGPFILKPGSVNNITVGVCYARSTDVDPFASVEVLRRADDKAQALFENCFRVLEGPHAPDLTIQELDKELILMISNPISSNNFNEAYSEFDPLIVAEDSLADKYYHFQGYQVFQLRNDEVSISELSNPELARQVAQCDIKDDFSRIINFEFDENLQASIPVEKVDGKNKGIQHTFSITEDNFALGNKTLVNFKTYYFMVVAYATNNYKSYNPIDPLLLDGQKKVYILSRKSSKGAISAVSAIPHNPISEAGGTVQSVEYGTTPRITRLDGTGNGGRNLELTQESTDYIVANGFMDNPTYDYGAGPINVKVVDPLNVADGYFECIFDDSGYNSTGDNGADSAVWTINRYDKKDGVLLESITGSVNILQDNEEVIPQWGVSVQINQIKYTGTTTAQTTKPITSSIDFADSSKRWLSFITDQDGFYFNNWIRSGTTADTALDASPIYTVPACYSDEMIGEVALDEEKLFTSLVGGGVAPYRLTGYQCDFMPFAYYNNPTLSSNSGVERTAARLAFLPSVDIVLTSDQSKWTRCPVIELGRDENTNYGNAKPGALRKSPSVGKDGQADNTGTGMSWFPGYAIDVETGARLYMAFGENSFLGLDNGSDMIWNPTDRFVDNSGNAIAGGQHPIYVFSHNNQTINKSNTSYDFPYYNPNNESVNEVYDLMQLVETGSSTAKRRLYGSMSWIANTILERDQELLSTAVTIKLRVEKEYKKFVATGVNNGLPMYSWSMNDIYTQTGRDTQLAKVLDIINVVPNPYYAYSEYERNRLDTKVKITNLPEVCTVSIYGVNGKLIRTFKKDSPQTYLDWDLNNHTGVPIASGIYLIHIDIPDIGEKVIKFLGGSRQVDLQNL